MNRHHFTSIVVAFMPLLSVYKSPVPGVDMATLVVLLTFVVLMLNEKKIKVDRRSGNFNLLLGYVVVVTLVNLIIFKPPIGWDYAEKSLVILRLVKFAIVIVVYFTFSFLRDSSLPMIMATIRLIVHINTLFILCQQILYLAFGIVVYNPFTNFAVVDIYQVGKYSMLQGFGLYRPSAFFLEPSHLAQYFLVYLCYVLYAEKNRLKRTWELGVTALGIICSGSGMGIVMLIALVALWGVWRLQQDPVRTFFAGSLVLIAFIMLLNTTFMQSVFSRLLTDNVDYGGNAIQARIGEGYTVFLQLDISNQLFGAGFGNVPSFFLNGIAYMLNTVGVFGIFLLLFSILRIFFRAKLWAKWVLICYVILLSASQMFSVDGIVYYIGIAYLTCEHKKRWFQFLRLPEVFER